MTGATPIRQAKPAQLPATGGYLCHIQTWVVRIGGRTILIDTGAPDAGSDFTIERWAVFPHHQPGQPA